MSDQDPTTELARAKEEIKALNPRMELLEQKLGAIPSTLLLSRSRTLRSFAVLGHVFLGCLAIYAAVVILLVLTGQIERIDSLW